MWANSNGNLDICKLTFVVWWPWKSVFEKFAFTNTFALIWKFIITPHTVPYCDYQLFDKLIDNNKSSMGHPMGCKPVHEQQQQHMSLSIILSYLEPKIQLEILTLKCFFSSHTDIQSRVKTIPSTWLCQELSVTKGFFLHIFVT